MNAHPIALGLALTGGSLTAFAAPAAPPLEVGQPFPDLILPGMVDGEPMSVADFRGQKLILHVFASW